MALGLLLRVGKDFNKQKLDDSGGGVVDKSEVRKSEVRKSGAAGMRGSCVCKGSGGGGEGAVSQGGDSLCQAAGFGLSPLSGVNYWE